MKAIRIRAFGSPEVLKLEEVPDLTPGPGQILIRIRAAGVNPADTYVRSGQYANLPPLPYTPGMDGSGIIEAIGPSADSAAPVSPAPRGSAPSSSTSGTATPHHLSAHSHTPQPSPLNPSLSVGSRVYIARSLTGTYAEQTLCAPHQVLPLPDNISFAKGAGVFIPYGTAYRGLVQRANAKPGEWLLIHGASGSVGLAALQFGRAMGLRIIGTAGTPEGLDLIKRQGAHHVVNHNDPSNLDQIRAITNYPAAGVDVILEMLSNVNLEKDLGLLAMYGRIVVIGARGPIQITPRQMMSRDSSILGMSMHNATPAMLAEIHAATDAGLRSGNLDPIVAHELPLAEAAKSHELVMQPGARGKIVLIP